MNDEPILDAPLQSVEIETAPDPRHAVIWLHGLGADGHDFEPVVKAMDLEGLPPLRFVFPHAPTRPVTINGGYVMRAWYDIVSTDFSQRREDPQGVRDSAVQLGLMMARENARGVPDCQIILAGFSQGGAVALHAGLRHPQRLAGILALSTYLPLPDTLADEADEANRNIPIFMAHGESDPVIPFDFARESRDLLEAAGYTLEWHEYIADHSVVMEELRDIEVWLRGVIGG
jgi:phospholipase/carboxylesterase